VFPSTTERKQSLLNFTKMLSYSPKRNICANGIAKLTSISTTQPVVDMLGKSLKDTTVTWNDSTDEDWLEHFLLILNSAFTSTNPYGKPLKKAVVDTVSTQLYQINNVSSTKCAYSFSAAVNGSSQNFEVVNADIDTTLNVLDERTPTPEQAFHILYRNDGSGNSSKNTGFFVYWKQGTLNYQVINFSNKIENNSYEIDTSNINEYDVWFQELNSSTGLVKSNWTKIANTEYLDYNNTDNDVRDVFKVETRDNDTIILRFSDGNFGTIPYGVFRVWYRVSHGNSNLYIKPADIKNVSVKIPYYSNNTTDENIYYLTLNFSVQDISHIRQSVVQEQVETIRENAPRVYSTQNRMVTGEDYNNFPKSYGTLIKKCKAVVRNYSGNSRYIQFNEGTGTYQDLNILAEDGYLYKDNIIESNDITVDTTTNSRTVVNDYILPMINSNGLKNYYFDNYQSVKMNTTVKWREKYTQGSNNSAGIFVDADGYDTEYSAMKSFIKTGNMLHFINSKTKEERWASIISYEFDELTYSDYTVNINEVLSEDDSEHVWTMTEYFNPFKTSLTTTVSSSIQELIDSRTSFGLTYNDSTTSWEIIGAEDLSNDTWIFKAEYNSPNMYSFYVKSLKYIFGSANTATFFFNTDTKISENEFSTKDYIKVLSINGYSRDYYWKPCETIRYVDGFEDNRKVYVYGYNSDKDESIDNPFEFQDMTAIKSQNLYFIDDSYNSNVVEIESLWGNTTVSGLYHCNISGTIYTAGTKLPHDVTITKTVKLSNGETLVATKNNPHTWAKGYTYDYDIVDDGKIVDFTWKSEIDPTVDEDYLADYEVTTVGEELLSWNYRTKTLTRYERDLWTTKTGIGNISFIWQHYASNKHLIDPCPTNIIDMYVLTTDYYSNVYNWLNNGKSGEFPKVPTATELRSMFADLEDYDMISDSMVWNPIHYRVLFGNQADAELRASFRVIKSDTTTLSVNCIDDYFEDLEPGQTFYYTKLSAYIDEQLGSNISSVVIVPSYSTNKFGNLFEINCDADEILLSSATIDDVQIISNITSSNIKIGQ
jgi:hypothetical protein